MLSDSSQLRKVKVALVGEEGVGKTSLIHRFVSGAFDPSYIRTLGVLVSKKTLTVRDPRRGDLTVLLMVHDVMGKITFMHLFQEAYFRGVQGVLAVFDVTRRPSLENLPRWVDAARQVAGQFPVVFLGNKIDLAERRETSDEDVARSLGAYGSPTLYTSALSGENVEEAFQRLAKAVLEASGREGPP